jgi:DNA-binding LytR/AlgR family response regulator
MKRQRLAEVIERASLLCEYERLRESEQERVQNAVRLRSPRLMADRPPEAGPVGAIGPDDILYFSAQDSLTKAGTIADSYLVNYKLSELEGALPPEMFFRAHRSALVNLRRVK